MLVHLPRLCPPRICICACTHRSQCSAAQCVFVHTHIRMHVCLPACLSVCRSICLSVRTHVCGLHASMYSGTYARMSTCKNLYGLQGIAACMACAWYVQSMFVSTAMCCAMHVHACTAVRAHVCAGGARACAACQEGECVCESANVCTGTCGSVRPGVRSASQGCACVEPVVHKGTGSHQPCFPICCSCSCMILCLLY